MTKLLFIDGADGVGKTTLITQLVETLTSKYNLPVKTFASLGGSELSMRIRELVMANGHLHKESHMAFVYLMMASMQDVFYGGVIPALKDGNYVIVDRGWVSTLVYNLLSVYDLSELPDSAEILGNLIEKLDRDLYAHSGIFTYLTILPKEESIQNILNRISTRKDENNHFDSDTREKYNKICNNYLIAHNHGQDIWSYCRYEIKTISHETTTDELVEEILRDVFKLA